jgi:phage baseplate assembly protein W
MSITTDKYIGPLVPLARNREFNGYVLVNEYEEEIKQNLKNIVLTGKGERMMDKDFGLGIRDYLFENKKSDMFEEMEPELKRQCEKYLPIVIIDGVEIDRNLTDVNAVGIKIFYSIPDLNVKDALDMLIR